MHSYYKGLMANPPLGYQFVTPESSLERATKAASKVDFSYPLFLGIDSILPLNLIKSQLWRFTTTPSNVDLTYSYDHLICRKEPWVVDLEYVSFLVSYNLKHFQRFKGVVQRILASKYCRAIICGTEAAQRTVSLNLDCTGFEHKLEIVPFAVRKIDFVKNFAHNKIKLLFVGSTNILGAFETKGGRETLEAFVLLTKKYSNLELIVRSDVPTDLKHKYSNCSNIRIIDQIVPWDILEQEFKSADIFVLPVHNTPFSAFLDAMSYELPIITIDAWANPEIVEDGKTGLLAQKSDSIPYYKENFLPTFGTPQFKRAIRTPDPRVVECLAEKISILIDNEELRRRMGRAGRWEIEHGRFSVAKRNAKLKEILDEATS
jgi:glycosyltransferase involved in cell wall biosynthesis